MQHFVKFLVSWKWSNSAHRSNQKECRIFIGHTFLLRAPEVSRYTSHRNWSYFHSFSSVLGLFVLQLRWSVPTLCPFYLVIVSALLDVSQTAVVSIWLPRRPLNSIPTVTLWVSAFLRVIDRPNQNFGHAFIPFQIHSFFIAGAGYEYTARCWKAPLAVYIEARTQKKRVSRKRFW